MTPHDRQYVRMTIIGPEAGALAAQLNEILRAMHWPHEMQFSCHSCVQEGTYFYDAGVWSSSEILNFFFAAIKAPFGSTHANKLAHEYFMRDTWIDCYPVSEN